MHTALVAWLTAAMAAWAPPKDDDVARYEAIARDLLAVALDPNEAPLFEGNDGRARTALLLTSFAAAESGGFRADVDQGRVRGAGGAVCILQVKVERGKTQEGWIARDLIADRTRCARAALHLMHASFEACHRFHGADRLGGYTHGHCVRGNRVAAVRWSRAARWMKAHPPPALPEGAPPHVPPSSP